MAICGRPFRMPTTVLLAALLVAGAILGAVVHGVAGGRIYSVNELRRALAHDPAAWRGRIVRVHGVAMGYTGGSPCYAPYPCSRVTYAVLWSDADAIQARGMMAVSAPLPANVPLLVTLGAPDGLLAFLRTVPFLRAMLPPQGIRWGVPATYRVHLSTALGPCAASSCASGTLLDAGSAGSAAVQGAHWSSRAMVAAH